MIQLVVIENSTDADLVRRAIEAIGAEAKWVVHNLTPEKPPAVVTPIKQVEIARNAYVYARPREEEMGIVFGASVYGRAKVSVYEEREGFLAISPAKDLWLPGWAIVVPQPLFKAITTMGLAVRNANGMSLGRIVPIGTTVSVWGLKDIPGYTDRAVITAMDQPEENVWNKGLKRL